MICHIAEQGNMQKGLQHMLGFGRMFQMASISRFLYIYEDVLKRKVFINGIVDSRLPYGGVHVRMFFNDQA